MAKVRSIAWDMDGSVFGSEYTKREDGDVVKAIKPVLDEFKESSGKYRLTRTFLGSNRQSLVENRGSSYRNKTICAFVALQMITKYLDGTLKKFLLADLYNNLTSGTSFDLGLKYGVKDDLPAQKIFPNWLHDKSKLSLLVVLVRIAVLLDPDDEHDFFFLDDDNAIRADLITYFSDEKNRTLIPGNMNLYIADFKGRENEKLHTCHHIKGTGPVKYTYAEIVRVIKEMAAVTIESEEYQKQLPMMPCGMRRVKNYEDTVACNFNVNPLSCVKSYTPGQKPVFPVPDTLVPALDYEFSFSQFFKPLFTFFSEKNSESVPNSPNSIRTSNSPSSSSSSSSTSLNLSSNPSPTCVTQSLWSFPTRPVSKDEEAHSKSLQIGRFGSSSSE